MDREVVQTSKEPTHDIIFFDEEKKLCRGEQKDLVTGRVTFTRNNRKLAIRFTFGNTLCELVGWTHKDRVNLFQDNSNADFILVRKCLSETDGLKLFSNNPTSAYQIEHRIKYDGYIKIKQTIALDYEFYKNEILISLSNLKWKN